MVSSSLNVDCEQIQSPFQAGAKEEVADTISHNQVDRLCRREPELGTRILWNLLRASSERLRDTTARLASGDFHEPTLPLD